MEFTPIINSLQQSLGTHLPMVLGAVAILAVGWLVAVLVRAGTRRGLSSLKVNEHLSTAIDRKIDIASMAASGIFWVVILFTLIAVFNALNLQNATGPFSALVTQITSYIPKLIAGVVLSLVAWVTATVLRAIVNRVLAATSLDTRLAKNAGKEPMSKNLSNVLFWLVILMFLPAILAAFQLQGMLEPVQAMLNQALSFLPNIVGAAAIGFVGWLVAKIVRGLVVNLLTAVGADNLGQRMGGGKSLQLSSLAGTLVFIFIFVPSLIAALGALKIDAISQPATDMLTQMFNAVPHIFAAGVILMVSWYVGRFCASLVSQLLAGLEIDALPVRLGLVSEQQSQASGFKPSALAGQLIIFFIMLFATAEAAHRLGFSQVREIVAMFIKFGGDILLGSIILLIGYWLANLAYRAMKAATNSGMSEFAGVARVAILGLVLAMGLRAMGIADQIVHLAFGLTLGAVAIAVAISFGLGGREAAGRLLGHWLDKWQGK